MNDFNLADYLPYRLAALSERVSHRLALEYGKSHGLSVAEWRVLVHLARHRQVSIREICAFVNLEKPRVSRAVQRLADGGLVCKRVRDEDQRLVSISLTPKGHEVLNEIIPAASAYEARLTAALDSQDLDKLSAIVEKLHSSLDNDPLSMPRPEIDK